MTSAGCPHYQSQRIQDMDSVYSCGFLAQKSTEHTHGPTSSISLIKLWHIFCSNDVPFFLCGALLYGFIFHFIHTSCSQNVKIFPSESLNTIANLWLLLWHSTNTVHIYFRMSLSFHIIDLWSKWNYKCIKYLKRDKWLVEIISSKARLWYLYFYHNKHYITLKGQTVHKLFIL